jgi:hypothetical protein
MDFFIRLVLLPQRRLRHRYLPEPHPKRTPSSLLLGTTGTTNLGRPWRLHPHPHQRRRRRRSRTCSSSPSQRRATRSLSSTWSPSSQRATSVSQSSPPRQTSTSSPLCSPRTPPPCAPSPSRSRRTRRSPRASRTPEAAVRGSSPLSSTPSRGCASPSSRGPGRRRRPTTPLWPSWPTSSAGGLSRWPARSAPRGSCSRRRASSAPPSCTPSSVAS